MYLLIKLYKNVSRETPQYNIQSIRYGEYKALLG